MGDFKIIGKIINMQRGFFLSETVWFSIFRLHLTAGIGSLSLCFDLCIFTEVACGGKRNVEEALDGILVLAVS